MGLDKAFQYLQDFGVTSLQEGDRHLALGLGGMQQGISPWQNWLPPILLFLPRV